ncbi:MAG TPA: HEAT repeat domain-containing protein [Desulfurivibrionaceae bacterium]|nr:HEAT repeat domain-containing protein [Desulfurivibrionaceae bacterium]
MDFFFKGSKVKKLVARYATATDSKEEGQLRAELADAGDDALRQVIEAFQQRRLTAGKAQALLDALCADAHQPQIVELIGDPYDEVRRVAKELLAKRWSKSASPHLLGQLKNADLYARNNAVELLTLFKDQNVTTDLVSLFNGSPMETKKGIIKILTTMGGPTAKKLILSALNDQEWQVRLAAVKSLGKMRAPESVEPLIEKLADKDPHMKALALDALSIIGDKRAAGPLLELLKDDDLLIRQQATDGLIRFADSTIVPQIIGLMRHEDVNVRRCAVEVLKNLRDPRTADELLKAMKDSDWWVRQIATSSLTEIKGDNNIIKAFITMTRDPDENVRRCAVEFFNKINDPIAYEALSGCLGDQDWWVREKAIRALGALKDERAIAPLVGVVDDRVVGWVVPSALAAIGVAAALDELKRLLFHPVKRVKIEAAKALAACDCKDAVLPLQDCLRDPDEEVRTEVIAALKQLTGKVYAAPDDGGADHRGAFGPRLPAGTSVTEAILVLDLCNSTDIANRYGDNFALTLMHKLTELVSPIARQEACRFMKGTGDGFLMRFPKAINAVRFARQTLAAVANYNATAEEMARINLRFAINLGEAKVDETGDRLGVAVSMTFRVEGVKPDGLIPIEGGMTKEAMPSVNRILITENVAKEISSSDAAIALVGLFELKGITGLHRIYAAR